MRYALQLYGVFRTFDVCLPHILHYIMYEHLDYDVFILSQRDDGYSPDNERLIRDMLGQRRVFFQYIEDYPESDHTRENELCKYYQLCVKSAKVKIQHELVTNDFVTRLWYRRWLNNQMRVDFERKNNIKYDWVVRTRFDIGYRAITNRTRLSLLTQPPDHETVYMFPDTFTCGTPEIINYESELVNHWPYVYNKYLESGRLTEIPDNYTTIKKWLFMSEMNLIQYFKGSKYKTHMIPPDLKIVRRDMVAEMYNHDIRNEHIISAHYGLEDKWIDVTDNFIELFVNQYDNRENGSLIVVNNSIAKCDPVPRCVKNLVITTLEGNEYVFKEHTTPLIKYQYFYSIECPLKDIKKVTYGSGIRQTDITKNFMTLMKKRRHILFISNRLSNTDPAPGDEKIATIVTNNGTRYEFAEYSILELT